MSINEKPSNSLKDWWKKIERLLVEKISWPMFKTKNRQLDKISRKDQKTKLRDEGHVIEVELLLILETGPKTR